MSQRTTLELGELARQVVENPIFQRAVDDMRKGFFFAFAESTEAETNIRELAWRNTRFLETFVGLLNGYLSRAEAEVVMEREEVDRP